MVKFAGFLKRVKDFNQKALHTIVKGATTFKKGARKYWVEPMAGIMTTVLPQVKPLTDAIFKVDDAIIKGMEWTTNKLDPNKTSSMKLLQQSSKTIETPSRNKFADLTRNNALPIAPGIAKSNNTFNRSYLNFNR